MGTPLGLSKPGMVKSLNFIEKMKFSDYEFMQILWYPARWDDKTAGHA